MLKELSIENLAVIASASIPFDRRLNAFTGETGAGKSILIHGINAVLGQRVTRDIVRTGTDRAVVTALFTELSDATKAVLREYGMDPDEDQITLTREIQADGGSVARINGKVATVSALKEIGSTLITIHGQHDNQILLAPELHLQVLDEFGGDDRALLEYQESFKALQLLARQLGTLKKAEAKKAERMEYLQTLTDDIGALNLRAGEEAELDEEYQVVAHTAEIADAIRQAESLLSSDDAANDLLRSAEDSLSDAAELMPGVQPLLQRLTAARIEATDIAEELSRALDTLDLDGERFEKLTKRRDAIHVLARRYQCDGDGLVALYESGMEELQALSGAEDEIIRLTEQKDALLLRVTEKAKALSNHRAQVADRFVLRVGEELRFLDMPQVQLAVRFTPGKLTIHGMETAEFLISANPGEPPKPIAKIASGGELSRIMLALKSVIADRDAIPTMIFDEIDTGVSGRAAQKIGVKLREIGKIRQVLCVTHLAQIAVMAQHHLLIEKQLVEDRTVTRVTPLDPQGRVAEIARIMGGENPSELMLQNAAAELERAAQMTE